MASAVGAGKIKPRFVRIHSGDGAQLANAAGEKGVVVKDTHLSHVAGGGTGPVRSAEDICFDNMSQEERAEFRRDEFYANGGRRVRTDLTIADRASHRGVNHGRRDMRRRPGWEKPGK